MHCRRNVEHRPMPPATARPRIRIVNRHREAFRAGRLTRPRQRRGNVLPFAGGESLASPIGLPLLTSVEDRMNSAASAGAAMADNAAPRIDHHIPSSLCLLVTTKIVLGGDCPRTTGVSPR